MDNNAKMNILFCLDDVKGDYTRHCAVTILSLLETNKNNKIKIYVLFSCLPRENIEELKRIVKSYDQEIKFIKSDDIVPEKLKKVIINKNSLTWGVRYRWFFPKFIKGVDRILSLDCDVLVVDDISEIYYMDMHNKAIAGYLDCFPYRCKNKLFGINNYINAGVLLFDTKKYDMGKINIENMEEINKKYSKFFHGSDQDKINILFKDDIFIYNKSMNYQIIGNHFNKGIKKAVIIHCLEKPYLKHNRVPNHLVKLYHYYLNLTKRKQYPDKDIEYGYIKFMCLYLYYFLLNFGVRVLGEKNMERLIFRKRRLEGYKSIMNHS